LPPGLGAGGVQAGRGGLGQVGGFAVADASFAAGQGEQCLQEALLVDAGFEEFLAGGAPLLDGCAGVAQRYLQQGAVEGERGAQFVGGVGDEVPLGGEGGFQAGQQVVEGAGEFFELIVGPGQGEPGPPRVFRTAKLVLTHAASCRFRYSSWASCGVR